MEGVTVPSSDGRFWLGLRVELAVFFKAVWENLLWFPACREGETKENSSQAKQQTLELVGNESLSV